MKSALPRRRCAPGMISRTLARAGSLRLRIVLLVVTALLPTFVLFLIHTQQEQQWLLGEAENRAMLIARAWNEHNSEYLDEANVLLRLMNEISPDGADCTQNLAALAVEMHWSAEIAFIDRSGRVLCSSQRNSALAEKLDASYVDDLFDSHLLAISDFIVDKSGRSAAFAGLRQSKGGGAARAAIAIIDLAAIQGRSASVTQGTPYAVTVVGRDGIVLARHPEGNIVLGKRLPADYPLMPELNVQVEGVATGRDAAGIQQIYAFSQVPQTGAKVVIELPREAVLGAEDQAVERILAALVIVTLFAAGGAWLMAEMSVLRWVSELTTAAIAFGRRDLDHRAIVPKRLGEFATLANAFNSMAEMLSLRQHELERRVAERTAELTVAQAELLKQERYSAIGQLAASVAHELRNPLGAAKNTLHTIEEIATARQLDIVRPVERLERSLSRCEQTIDNLVDYVDAGDLTRQDVLFERWLDEWLDAQRLHPSIELVRDFAAPQAMVALDNHQLALAIDNILDNAVRAILDGGAKESGKVTVTLRAAEKLTLAFEDTGAGLDAETLTRIFDPFFSTRGFGLGLGLPTARKIIEEHGGTVTAESQVGFGTRLTVILPLLGASTPVDGLVASDGQA
jgi:signal transduction histidine kinase